MQKVTHHAEKYPDQQTILSISVTKKKVVTINNLSNERVKNFFCKLFMFEKKK